MAEVFIAQAFIAMGSNIDAERRLLQAARELKRRFAPVRFSHCYSNPSYGFDGPPFVNAVAGLRTALTIAALLTELHEVEALCGRAPTDPKWEPRAMDLDLLLYGDVVGSGPGYTLPRPDLLQRVYMLGPLAELAPQWLYPPAGPTIAELWRRYPRGEHPLCQLQLDLNGA
jgi:2-amino-4-hydroxy-6-hydroxymethyldihydropteridine diphosphokinase